MDGPGATVDRRAARALILPLALAQFIASYAATNMNVAISALFLLWFFLHIHSREKR